jgi:hypothetical protein
VRLVLACSLAVLALLAGGCGGKKTATTGTTTGAARPATTAAPNGIASKSADRIVASMREAVANAKSVHVVGAATTGGTSMALELKLVTGKGGAGHIAIDGLGFDIVRIGNKIFFKGQKKFLVHYAGPTAQLLAGKWFVVKAGTRGFGSLAPLTSLDGLVSQILSTHGKLEKGATTTIDGQPAIAIKDSTSGGTLFVATTGPAYPLRLTPGPTKGKGVIDFRDWDQPIVVKRPPGAIDYAKLTGG